MMSMIYTPMKLKFTLLWDCREESIRNIPIEHFRFDTLITVNKNVGMTNISHYLFCWFDLFSCLCFNTIHFHVFIYLRLGYTQNTKWNFRLVRLNYFTQTKWTTFCHLFKEEWREKKKTISKRKTHNNWIYAEKGKWKWKK